MCTQALCEAEKEEGSEHLVDRKSLDRLVARLIEAGQIKEVKCNITVETDQGSKERVVGSLHNLTYHVVNKRYCIIGFNCNVATWHK